MMKLGCRGFRGGIFSRYLFLGWQDGGSCDAVKAVKRRKREISGGKAWKKWL
jgi:hypothetical protein